MAIFQRGWWWGGVVSSDSRQCVFCLEEIRPGATVCPHCRSSLAPFQNLADTNLVLEQRVSALEQVVAQLQAAHAGEAAAETGLAGPPAGKRWPHMFDNIVLGMATLLVAHWLATLLPVEDRALFRLVGLVVALPFGYRFQWNSRSDRATQIFASVAFGSLGTILNGVLDLALADHRLPAFAARDVVMSVVAITLSHYAGSALAEIRQKQSSPGPVRASVQRKAASPPPGSLLSATRLIEPTRIKTAADMVKALYDAAVPLAAGAAALWAAIGHIQF